MEPTASYKLMQQKCINSKPKQSEIKYYVVFLCKVSEYFTIDDIKNNQKQQD